MRITDAVQGFPAILLALIIVTIQDGADYVTLATVAGVSRQIIMLWHIFPNVINTILIIISLRIGQTILLEASLSFLGVGVPPGEPAWGIWYPRAGIT